MCKFLSRVATITKTTIDKYTISTVKDKGENEKKNAATPPHIRTQPDIASVNRGNMRSEWTGMSIFGVPDTARESRDTRASRFPGSLGFGTKNRWQVEARQPCRASADRADILGANVDALFAYRPAEK